MFKLKLAMSDEDILSFEQLRTKVFDRGKTINNIKKSAYAAAIKSGDFLAFECFDDKELVGGMLLRLEEHDIKLSRLFVDKSERSKGAGSFMIDYIMDHKEFFEDYYATKIYGVITEPLDTAIDFYFDKGFDYSGYQMYKEFNHKR